ncbi:28S ribosomal protein S16 [Striga asiatica]|uniref:28S ribosomal protein S16 n=1 Tax=Striga asiatica TaxID=4170 RepID=A0A5A7Q2J3_STRAF|nr:28S ribosomal protein S16 [Striga asiatica]
MDRIPLSKKIRTDASSNGPSPDKKKGADQVTGAPIGNYSYPFDWDFVRIVAALSTDHSSGRIVQWKDSRTTTSGSPVQAQVATSLKQLNHRLSQGSKNKELERLSLNGFLINLCPLYYINQTRKRGRSQSQKRKNSKISAQKTTTLKKGFSRTGVFN